MTREIHHRRTLRRLILAFMAALFLIGISLAVTIQKADAATPPAAVQSATLAAKVGTQTDPGCVYSSGGWYCYGTLPPSFPVEVTRLGGATRVETAAAIATYTPVEGETVLIVANGDTMVDAIAAGTKFTDTPLVLVRTGEVVPPATLEAASAIAPDRVIVLGGPDVVSDAQAHTILYALVP